MSCINVVHVVEAHSMFKVNNLFTTWISRRFNEALDNIHPIRSYPKSFAMVKVHGQNSAFGTIDNKIFLLAMHNCAINGMTERNKPD